jgi:heptosyltransferase-3
MSAPPTKSVLKKLEWLFKVSLAVLLGVVLWRPRRTLRSGPHRVLLVRLDNRVGEALLTTPLIDALATAGHSVDVLVHPKVRRVLEGHPRVGRLWDYRPHRSMLQAIRANRYDVVINCGNWDEAAVTSAVVARLVGTTSYVIGPQHFPAGWLMDVKVAPLGDTRSEAAQRRHLGSPLVSTTGPARLSFRDTPPQADIKGRYAVVNPGGRLGFRRVSPHLFAFAAQELLRLGVVPVVTWGPGEEPLADEVVTHCPGAVRAPATSLEALASLMRGAEVTVCNNTGPMHLSVAVGCKTVALFLHMEVERWGHAYPPHHMVDLTGLEKPEAAIAQALR